MIRYLFQSAYAIISDDVQSESKARGYLINESPKSEMVLDHKKPSPNPLDTAPFTNMV